MLDEERREQRARAESDQREAMKRKNADELVEELVAVHGEISEYAKANKTNIDTAGQKVIKKSRYAMDDKLDKMTREGRKRGGGGGGGGGDGGAGTPLTKSGRKAHRRNQQQQHYMMAPQGGGAMSTGANMAMGSAQMGSMMMQGNAFVPGVRSPRKATIWCCSRASCFCRTWTS